VLQKVASVAFEFVKDMLDVTIPGTIQLKSQWAVKLCHLNLLSRGSFSLDQNQFARVTFWRFA